jgi:predicted metalloprotease with PDZ domain
MKFCVAACLAAMSLASAYAGRNPAEAAPDTWIQRLASDEFAERQQAGENLAEWAKNHAEEARDRFFVESAKNPDPEVRKRCRDLLRELVLEKFRSEGPGYVGIQMGQLDVPLDKEGNSFGVRVAAVVKDTPAKKAGLKVGDVIVELDGKRWEKPGAADAFKKHVMARKPGDVVTMQVVRKGQDEPVEIKVKLARRPVIPNTFLFLRQRPGMRIGGLPDIHELERLQEEKYFNDWYEKRSRAFDEAHP